MSRFLLEGALFGLSKHTACLASTAAKPAIENLVKAEKVVVFMKGIPEEPRCGFSNAVIQILKMHGVHYKAHNVLEDDNIREGVKQYSNWPTIPQVFINGEFVGGCDILLEMHKSGALVEELQKVGIISSLLEQAQKNEEENQKNQMENTSEQKSSSASK